MVNGMTNASLIDLSVQERSLKEAKREFCSMLSERTLLALLGGPAGSWGNEELITRAWTLAEMQYDEMIRRRTINTPVTLQERMALDSVRSEMATHQ